MARKLSARAVREIHARGALPPADPPQVSPPPAQPDSTGVAPPHVAPTEWPVPPPAPPPAVFPPLPPMRPGFPLPSPGQPGFPANFDALTQQLWAIEGERHSQRAMTFAIIGLFFAGLLFGILALQEAAASRRFGIPNSGAETLAWIDIIGFCLALPFWLLFMVIR